jgi:hypothetical protein
VERALKACSYSMNVGQSPGVRKLVGAPPRTIRKATLGSLGLDIPATALAHGHVVTKGAH